VTLLIIFIILNRKIYKLHTLIKTKIALLTTKIIIQQLIGYFKTANYLR